MQENWDLIFAKYGAMLTHYCITKILTLVINSAFLNSNGTCVYLESFIPIYAVCYDDWLASSKKLHAVCYFHQLFINKCSLASPNGTLDTLTWKYQAW